MNPADNRPQYGAYGQHSYADKIAAANEAQRQKDLSPEQRQSEELATKIEDLQEQINSINGVIDKMHFAGNMGITGTARTGWISNFPDARVTCVNGVARLILNTNG